MADSKFRTDKEHTERTRKENDEFVKKIIKYCTRSDYKKHNVLLVGQSGSGKSSVINTVLYPITGEYLERAKPGAGNVTTKTLDLKWYPNCAAKPADFEHLDDEETEVREAVNGNPGHGNLSYQKKFKNILDKLPDLFDAAGMKNRNDPKTREILGLLIGGFINPNTNIALLEEEQEENGLGWLQAKYSTAKDEYKMSCVLFVCSCVVAIPHDLIKCVRKVIEEVDPKTSRKKYDCDVFVLITKLDKVKSEAGTSQGQAKHAEILYSRDSSHRSEENKPEDSITLEKFEELEEEIAEAFVMKGNFKDSHLRWASYNDLLPPGNVHVDNKSLKLLLKLTTPLHIDQRVDTSRSWLLDAMKHVVFRVKGFSGKKYEMDIGFLSAVLVVFIAFLCMIYWGLNSAPVRKY